MREEHFLNHCRLFPGGNFVALHGERVIGLGSGFLIDFDFEQRSTASRKLSTAATTARMIPGAIGTTAAISAYIRIFGGAALARCYTGRA